MSESSPPLPLSFAQERLWFMHRLAPQSAFYNLQIDIPLPVALDEAVWRHVLAEIVSRHEILRTVFDNIEGQPIQRVLPAMELPLQSIDLREMPADAREEAAARLAGENARYCFDLATGPMVRVLLLRLADEAYVSYLTMHHIVTDGWSMDVLTYEIAVLYDAFAQALPSPLPELPIQYADFATWQRQTFTDNELAGQLAYWTGNLEGHSSLSMPTDYPRPSAPSYQGGFQTTVVAPRVIEGIRRLCHEEGATLFMGLLAAFQVLLMRYSAQEDIVVGTPIANRNQPELEGLIGFFVNTLVMRGRLEGKPPFREYLRQVRETALGAYANQDLPFEKLIEELHPHRDLSRNPLFQIMFVLQTSMGHRSGPAMPPSYQAAPSEAGEVSYGSSKFDLTFYLTEDDSGVSTIVEYSTDLFADATIARLITHWQTLLQSIAADPDLPVTRLQILPPGERAMLLTDWNRTDADYPCESSLVELFEHQARERPDAIALDSAEGRLSYLELDERSRALAHWLVAAGVRTGTIVGVSLPRGADMIVSLLAILRVGGAYLPLDPSYPAVRLTLLVEDAEPALVLSRSDCAGAVETHAPALLDQLELPSGDAELTVTPGPESLAYVLYTSGSTGTPKGVCVSHRNIVRLVRGTNCCELGPDEVLLGFAPLQFDASTFEIWGALLNGARLEIMPAGQVSLADLADAIERRGVTTLWLTASLFHQLVEGYLGSLWRVRQLLAGGDVLAPDACQRVIDELPGCTLINGYGPTETTTFAACHPMRHGDRLGSPIPIGRAVSNTRLYVLDEEGQLAPIGVPGELHIGGDGVSMGYLHRDELTASRFVDDPFEPPHLGRRLYRSGDRARFRGDGVLEFLGRRDFQVKVRGFRIELGEIEAAMRHHPLVHDACVVLHELRSGDKRLYGYAVLEDPQSAADVRLFLQGQLPDHAVPALVIGLAALPLNASGKVDRAALPLPAGEQWTASARFSAPQSAMEQLIASLWCELLGLERVGLHDNFFDMGGHSLLLMQVHSRLVSELERPIAVVDLFRYPTVDALARALKSGDVADEGTTSAPMDDVEERVRRQRDARANRPKRRPR